MTRARTNAREVSAFNASWRKRFGLDSAAARICAPKLVDAFARDFSRVGRDFRLFSEASRSSSAPPNAASLCKTAFFQTFAPVDERLSFLSPDETLDAALFLAQTYVAQTVAAVFARYFALNEEETRALLGASPFDWGAVVRADLNVDDAFLDAVRFDDYATRRDPFADAYAKFFPASTRQALGEFYTPQPLAEYLYRRALERISTSEPTILDPTCGAGVFLTTVVRDLVARGVSPRGALSRVVGFDLSPLAALTARANLIVAATSRLSAAARRDAASSLATSNAASIFKRDALLSTADDRLFDVVLGNPPWLAWDKLSPEYRRATEPLWREFGLFDLSGKEARYGGSKKELASLIAYSVVANRLKPGGVLGFVLPKSLFQTNKAGGGFRRFGAQTNAPFQALAIDDFSDVNLFPYVASKASTLLARKGAQTIFPVPLRSWRVDNSAARSAQYPDAASQTLGLALHAVLVEGDAAPDDDREGAPLRFTTRTQTPNAAANVREGGLDRQSRLVEALLRLAREDASQGRYRASLGANAAGGSGVFWLEDVGSLAEPLVTVRNRFDSGKRAVEQVEAQVESELLFPLLRWRDVDEYRVKPTSTMLLCPQDPKSRRGFAPEIMRVEFPRALEYLARFEAPLRERAAYKRYQSRAPYWSLYNVDVNTFAQYKVVWRRMDATMRAAVVGPDEERNRPIVPQETLSLAPVRSLQEADYLCAALNSSLARELFANAGTSGSKSFGSPGALDAFPLPVFAHDREECLELAQIGRERRESANVSPTAELR